MNVEFLPHSILIREGQVHEYVYLIGVFFWLSVSLSGLLALKSNRSLALPAVLFTLVSFLPFSYLCYDSYRGHSSDEYKVLIDANAKTVRFGDSHKTEDIITPFSEWISYRIVSGSESKKDKVRYTDTIQLEHSSGFYLELGAVSVTDYKEENKPFSRYAELNREMRKFRRILYLPILTVYGKTHPGILLKDNEGSAIKQELGILSKGSFPNISFPFRWKYTVSNANYSFFASLLLFGHLGVLLVWLSINGRALFFRSLLLAVVFYSLAGLDFWFYIRGKNETEYKIEETSSSFVLYSLPKGKPPYKESEMVKGKGLIPSLQLPLKRILFIPRENWEKTRHLAEQIDQGKIDGTLFALAGSTAGDWKEITWEVSDLPMEEVTSLFLKLNAVKE